MSVAQLMNRMHLLKRGGVSGVAALPDNFTYDATDITPLFIYNAADASVTDWAEKNGGMNLSATSEGTGGAPTLSTFGLGASVKFNGDGGNNGEPYVADTADSNDITTADFILEMIIRDEVGGCYVSKGTSSGGAGWLFRQNAGTDIRGRIDGDGVGRNMNAITTPSSGTWRYLAVAFDGGSGDAWVYDSVSDSMVFSRLDFGAHTTVDTTGTFKIGGYSTGGLCADLEIARIACYAQNGVIDLSAQVNILAACRARVDVMGGTRGAALA